MRSGIQFGLLLAAGLFVMGIASVPAQADAIPECIASEGAPEGEAQAWWDRRNATEQRLLRELPCDQRHITTVCIFLYDPDVVECTNRGVARYLSARHCADQGHALLSESEAACKAEFEAGYPPTFTN